MSLQTIVIGLVIATLCGASFHLLRGGKFRHLLLYLFTAWISFFIGQIFSESIAWRLLRMGALNLFPALLATLLGLIFSAVFLAPERQARKR